MDNIINLTKKNNNKKIMIKKTSWGKGTWCIVNKVIYNDYNEYGDAYGYINYKNENTKNGMIQGSCTYSWNLIKVLDEDLEIEYRSKLC